MKKLSNWIKDWNWEKVVSICLCLCLVANVLSFVGEVKAADEKWAKYTKNTAYTGAVTEDATGGVTLSSRAAVYYKEAVTVQAGTKISLDVQIPTVASGKNVQYALGLTSGADSFHNVDAVATTTTMVTELTGLGNANTLTAGGAIRLPGGSRSVKVAAVTLTNGRANIPTTTYNITYEKQATTSNYSWVMTAKEVKTNGNTVTMNISKNDIGHDVYANGAYIIAGAMNGEANSIKVSNVTVTQPTPTPDNPDDSDTQTIEWEKYTANPTGYTGTFATSDGEVTLNAKAAAYVKEKVTVQEGTKISMDVQMPTVVENGLVQYAFGLSSVANKFHNADATATGTTLVTEFVSLGTATTMTAGGAIRLPSEARVPNVPAPVTLTNGRANISTTTYNITFEKQAMTSDNSWVITAKEDKTNGTVVTMNIPKDKISHEAFADGVYIIAGAMCGTANTLEVSNVTVTQPEIFVAEWEKYTGNPNGYTGTFATSDGEVTLNAKAAAYVKEKVTVQEGTKISMDVQMPTVVENGLVQYAFGLSSVANKFHNADATATGTTLVTEFVSLGTATTMTAGGAIRLPSEARVPNVPAPVTLTNGRANISTTTYNITFEKQATTSDNSWIITAKEDKTNGTVVTMNIPKDKISHEAFADGVYIIAGAMCGTANILEVSNVTVTQPGDEPDTPDTPDQPDTPDGPTVQWTKYTANPTGYTGTFATSDGEVTLNAKAAAYTSEKVTVAAGTKISMDVQMPTIVEGGLVQYAFGLSSVANKFHNADATATGTTLVTELVSLGTATTMTAGGAIRLPGAARVPNVPAPVTLTNGRANISTTTYKITFEKQASTSANSWVMTAKEDKANGNVVTMNVPKDKISHEAFADGAYIIVGSMCGTANTLKVSNVTVTESGDEPDTPNPPVNPDEPDEPEDENGAWKTISSMTAGGILTEDASYNGDASFENKVAAYYKEKITVEENTYVSFKTKFPVLSEGEMLHYGFSLVNAAGCFYTSNNGASSVSAELQSSTNNNWQMASIASKKIAPATGRTFLANIGVMASKRSTTDEFEITLKKIDKTVGDINYSWEITVKNLTTEAIASYNVKASDVAHDTFDNGAYLAVGVMNGNGYTMEISDVKTGIAVPAPETAWEAIRGYAGADFTTSSNAAVTLIGGKGGAYRKEAFTLPNNTSISLQYEAKALTKNNSNDFYIMWLDKPSLANGAGDSGTGYALQMRTSADYSNFTLYLREVINGRMGTDNSNADLKIGGGAISASALNQKINVIFTRRKQTIEGVEYYGSVTVSVAGNSYVKNITMADAERVFGDLDKSLYLMAGNMNNIDNTFEVRNVNIAPLPVVQSVAGLWKALEGYTADTLSAVVNKKGSVDLHGKGTAYLSEPMLKTSSGLTSLSFTMTGLTNNYHNKFTFAVLDKKGSFVNGSADAGNGFVVEFRSFDQFEKGYAVYVATVTNGKTSDFEKLENRIVLGDMTKAKFNIQLTRKSNSSWVVKVSDKTYSKTLTHTLNSKTLSNLTAGNTYLSAGNLGMDMKAVIGY